MREKTKNLTIGFFIAWIENSYQTNLLSGIRDAAKETGINLMSLLGGAVNSPRNHEKARNIIYDFVDKEHFDGIIIAGGSVGTFMNKEEMENYLKKYYPLPIVSISRKMNHIHSILMDNSAGLIEMVEHLITCHGYKKIAFVGGPLINEEAIVRFNEYKNTLKNHNIEVREDFIVHTEFTNRGGGEGIRILLDERKARFEAVVAANDNIAFGIIKELKSRNILIPYDIAVTGFDDLDESRFFTPKLTTIKQPFYEQGKAAVKTLLRIIRGKKVPRETYLPSETVIRESCGCFRPPPVKNTAQGKLKRPPRSPDNTLKEKKVRVRVQKQIISSLKRNKIRSGSIDIMEIINAFREAMESRDTYPFINHLNRLFVQAGNYGRPFFLYLLDVLQVHFSGFYNKKEEKDFFEGLWRQSRLHGADFYQNISMYENVVKEKTYRIFRDLSEELVSITDMDSIIRLLNENLPTIGITSCFISLYEGHNKFHPRNSTSRLILAYNEKGRIDTGKEGILFPSKDLIPLQVLNEQTSFSFLVEPVFFGTNQLGVALFDIDLSRGLTYDIMRRMLINSALKGAIFIQQMRDQADTLEKANAKLTMTLGTLQNTRDRLVQSEKMAALGNLVAGIAHEINTPLGIGVTASSHLESETRMLDILLTDNRLKKSDLEKYMTTAMDTSTMVLSNLKRAYGLIKSFKKIAVDQSIEEKRRFNVKGYINEILLSLKPKLKNRMINADIFCENSLEINSYPGAFSQIITNLMMNALIHAFDDDKKGNIIITATKKDDRFSLQFTDNGKGIKPEYQAKIFDPFFTTKRSRGGTGLGLHILFNIVTRKLEGTIRCTSTVGAGSTFFIKIPLGENL